MRFVAILLFLAGAALGLAYPWAHGRLSGRDIGSWRTQDAAAGYRPVSVALSAGDAPVAVSLDVAAVVPPTLPADQTVLTITAASGGKTVLARTLDIADAEIRDDSPQTSQKIYRLDAGSIVDLADGEYDFAVGPGDAEGVEVLSVDLMLRSSGGAIDQRAQPLGFALMAIGFILLVISLRRGDAGPGQENPNSQPPPRKRWGRAGGTQ